MIRLTRENLASPLAGKLAKYTGRIAEKQEGERCTKARALWKSSHVKDEVRPALRTVLEGMAAGRRRCMYCGDNHGTDIDHFEPVARAPLRTFDRHNHLLVCSGCNSRCKRVSYPCDEAGRPMLIDPTVDDPLVHLHLVLRSGTYEHLTPRGLASIKVYGLDRPELEEGRRDAFWTARSALRDWREAVQIGDVEEAAKVVRLAWNRPLADVLTAMFHQARLPAASILFRGHDDVLALLASPDLRAAFLDRT